MIRGPTPVSFAESPDNSASKVVHLWNTFVFWSFTASLVLFCRAFFAFGGLEKMTPSSSNSLSSNASTTLFGNNPNHFDPLSRCGVSVSELLPEHLLNGGLSQLGDCSEYTNFTNPSEHPPEHANNAALANAVSTFPHTPSHGKATLQVANPFVDSSPASSISPHAGLEATHLSTANILQDPDYDPLEMEPFFSLEEFDDEGLNFALRIWLDKKDFYAAKLTQVTLCQASSGVKCITDE